MKNNVSLYYQNLIIKQITVMKNERYEVKLNKVVDFTDEEILVLGDIFFYADGFMGATGSRFCPISKAEYKERTKKANVKDYIRDCFSSDYILDNFGSLEKAYKMLKNNDDIESFMFDTSYTNLWDYFREELKLSEKDAYIFDCVGGGRCFDKDFQGNVNPELSELIRLFESSSATLEDALKLKEKFNN